MAMRLIGMLFCGTWLSVCQKCDEKSFPLTEHILLYCPGTNTIRNVLWRRLLMRFGVDFYKQFITLSPSDQVNALFSGFYGLVQDDNDRIETLKIFLKTLKLLQWHLNCDNLKLTL